MVLLDAAQVSHFFPIASNNAAPISWHSATVCAFACVEYASTVRHTAHQTDGLDGMRFQDRDYHSAKALKSSLGHEVFANVCAIFARPKSDADEGD